MNNFVPWVYIDDRGRGYITKALQEETAQEVNDPLEPILGGRTPAGADLLFPPLPSSVKPRRVRVADNTGYVRTVRVFEAGAPMLTNDPKPTISVEDSDGAAHVCSFEQLYGESFGKRAR